MIYIFAYRLKRKNARRKIYVKMEFPDQTEALQQFKDYCRSRDEYDKGKKIWELLTGDWKHVTYYCDTCKKLTEDGCEQCCMYDKFTKGNETK